MPEKSQIQISNPFETTDEVLNMLRDNGLDSLIKNKKVVKKTIGMMS